MSPTSSAPDTSRGDHALDDICERVRRLFATSRTGTCLSRFDIGVEVRRAMLETDKYGARAVKRIARSIGRSEDSLYAYASLPDTWPRVEFEALSARASKRGVPLGVSVFLAVAKQAPAARERLLAFAYETNPTVRGVEREAKRLLGAAEAEGRGERAAFEAVVRGLRVMRRAARSVADALGAARATSDTAELAELARMALELQISMEAAVGRVLAILGTTEEAGGARRRRRRGQTDRSVAPLVP